MTVPALSQIDLGGVTPTNASDAVVSSDVVDKNFLILNAPGLDGQGRLVLPLGASALQSWSAAPVDSSATVQAAIDAIWTAAANNGGAGGDLKLGSGIWYGSFKLRPGVNIIGSGFGTTFRAMPSQTASVLDYHTYDAYHVTLRDCRVDGNQGAAAACRCIDMTSSSNDAIQGPPLTTTASNDFPPYGTTWDNPWNIVDNVYVSWCAGDWAIYIGKNQRGAMISNVKGEVGNAGAMLVACTDAHIDKVSLGAFSDGIRITGTTNKFVDVKSWYHGNAGISTGPNGAVYYKDGFHIDTGSANNYGGNTFSSCESQDNIRYGWAFVNCHSSVGRGCTAGGEGQAGVYVGGGTMVAFNDFEILVGKGDRQTTPIGLLLDGQNVQYNRFQVKVDVQNAIPATGYVPLSYANGANGNYNELDLAFAGHGIFNAGNMSGTYNIGNGYGDYNIMTLTGNLTIADMPAAALGQQRRIVFMIKQAGANNYSVTWGASYLNAPAMNPTPNGWLVAEFVNVSANATPVWVCTTPKLYTDQTVKRSQLTSLAAGITKQMYHQQIPQIIISGTFVARDTTVYLSPDLQGTNYGGGFGLMFFYVGQNGGAINTPLYNSTGLAAAAGVTNFQYQMIAQFDYEAQNRMIPQVTITGLTPGQTYTYQFAGGLEGGSDFQAMAGNTAQYLDITPDDSVAWVSFFGSNTIQPVTIGLRPGWRLSGIPGNFGPTHSMVGAPIPVGTWPMDIKISPNGQYGAVNNFLDGTVTVWNAKTGVLIGTSAVLAAGKGAQGMAWTQDSAVVWVGCTDGKVYPITPTLSAAPTVGAGVLVNIANDTHVSLCLSADGKTLFIADGTANKVFQGTLTSNTVVTITANTTTLRAATMTSSVGTLGNCPTYTTVAAAIALTVAPFTLTTTVTDANKAHFDPGGGTIQVPIAGGYVAVTYTKFVPSTGVFSGCVAASAQTSVAGNVVLDSGCWSGGVGYIDHIPVGSAAYDRTNTLAPSRTVGGLKLTHDNGELWWVSTTTFLGCVAPSDASTALAPGGAGGTVNSLAITSDGYLVYPLVASPSNFFVLPGGLCSFAQGGFPAQGVATVFAEGATLT